MKLSILLSLYLLISNIVPPNKVETDPSQSKSVFKMLLTVSMAVKILLRGSFSKFLSMTFACNLDKDSVSPLTHSFTLFKILFIASPVIVLDSLKYKMSSTSIIPQKYKKCKKNTD